MHFADIYGEKFGISFEIFPPKTLKGAEDLFCELDILVRYAPVYISVTYGAGGSTREKTLDLAMEVRKRYGIDPLVHFTCIGFSVDEIREYLMHVMDLGLENILALRGDPPAGSSGFNKHENGFSFANELVAFIKTIGSFNVAVAGYPEKHPEAVSFDSDIINLKKKIDAGGEAVITQLFMDNSTYFRYVDLVRSAGIDVPVIPGIMPLTNSRQIEKMVDMSGAVIPGDLRSVLDKCSSDDEILSAGIDFAVKQCSDLLEYGVPGFHFYPLNKSYAVSKVLDSLGVECRKF